MELLSRSGSTGSGGGLLVVVVVGTVNNGIGRGVGLLVGRGVTMTLYANIHMYL